MERPRHIAEPPCSRIAPTAHQFRGGYASPDEICTATSACKLFACAISQTRSRAARFESNSLRPIKMSSSVPRLVISALYNSDSVNRRTSAYRGIIMGVTCLQHKISIPASLAKDSSRQLASRTATFLNRHPQLPGARLFASRYQASLQSQSPKVMAMASATEARRVSGRMQELKAAGK